MPGVVRMENGASDTGDLSREEVTQSKDVISSRSINGTGYLEHSSKMPQSHGLGKPSEDEAINGGSGRAADDERDAVETSVEMRSKSPAPLPQVDTRAYKDLAELITRIVQETLNELAEVVQSMAEMSGTSSLHHHHQPSGRALTNGNGNNSAVVSVRKKQRLMKFLQDRKAQFIKLLVLAQWTRNTEKIQKTVDLLTWIRTQQWYHDDALMQIYLLGPQLSGSKLPNPDLVTALEVLSTGQVSTYPAMEYLPPEPLTPQEMLKTLQNLNTILSIRLNLREELPPHFRRFRIASGRATFTVPDEFAVDLSIADEDPLSQLHFVDFRFTFTPMDLELLSGNGALLVAIEEQTNEALKKDGLAGCYNFLHELVLTHKITILRQQAQELIRGKWADALRLEMVRRSLIVQYWLDRPGAKSWIEIGITSGKQDASRNAIAGQMSTTSRITIRWTRNGQRVEDPPIKLDLANVSLEAILKHVLALHTNHFLRAIRDRLIRTPLYGQRMLSLALTMSSKDPAKSSLRMQLTPSRTATVSVAPIGGRFAIQPASALSHRTESSLNSVKDPAADGYGFLATLRCLVAREEIEHRAKVTGWVQIRTLNPRVEDIKRVFPKGTFQASFFTRPGWSSGWIIAVSIGVAGEAWWILELLPHQPGHSFGDSHRIPIATATGRAVDPTYEFLSRLARIAASMITHYVNMRALHKYQVDHKLLPARSNVSRDQFSRHTTRHLPTLILRLSSLMSLNSPSSSHPVHRKMRAWAKDVLTLSHHLSSHPAGTSTLLLSARLLNPKLFAAITSPIDEDIAFHPTTGAFAFRLTLPVGEPAIVQIKDRLQRIERLIMLLHAVRKFQLQIDSLSLGKITVRYPPPSLLFAKPATLPNNGELIHSVTIDFAPSLPIQLTFPVHNPHLRILDQLTSILHTDTRHGLEHVMLLLHVTLPLLSAFDRLERSSSPCTTSIVELTIIPHSPISYLLRYSLPESRELVFSIRLRQRKDTARWFLCPTTIQPISGWEGGRKSVERAFQDAALDQTRRTTIEKTLLNGIGDGWQGLGTGIVASLASIAEVVHMIDNAVRG